jgi:hypothetical protein
MHRWVLNALADSQANCSQTIQIINSPCRSMAVPVQLAAVDRTAIAYR